MNAATHHPETPATRIPRIRDYQNWLREQRGLSFASYHDVWRW